MRKKIIIVILIVFIIGMIMIVAKDIIRNKSKFVDNHYATTKKEAVINKKIALINSGANLDEVAYNKELNIETYNILDGSTDIIDNNNNSGTREFAALYNNFNSLNLKNDIILIKAFDKKGKINTRNIAQAIEYARENNAEIISLPFSFTGDKELNDEIVKCQEKGIMVVVNNQAKLAGDSQAIFVMGKIGEHANEILINNKNQLSCLKTKCSMDKSLDLSTVFVTGFLATKADYQDYLNKTLTPGYTIK